jgi:hypothetical protein
MSDYAGDPLNVPDTIPIVDDGDTADAATIAGVSLEGLMDTAQYLKRGGIYTASIGTTTITWATASLVRIPGTFTANCTIVVDDYDLTYGAVPKGHRIRFVRTAPDPDWTVTIRRNFPSLETMAVMPIVGEGPYVPAQASFFEIMWDLAAAKWIAVAWSANCLPLIGE